MAATTVSEVIGCDNPLLQFFYQENGVLQDVEALSFEIFDYAGTSKHDSGALDLTLCSETGVKLGTGRYAADVDIGSLSLTAGTHRITWSYDATAGGPTKKWSQTFEVLDDSAYNTGLGYRSYTDSSELVNNTAFLGSTIAGLQELGLEIAIWIENLTGRYFEPRFATFLYNSSGSGAIPIQEPIIGIESVNIVSGGVLEYLLEIDKSSLVVYNRHLQVSPGGGFMHDYDDRDNPRIEFVTDLDPGPDSARFITQGRFPSGRQNIEIKGVFGYTDPDGTHIGTRSRILKRVAGMLALRRFLDPFAQDVSVSQPARIREARTRDQQVKYGGVADGSVGPITGDRTIDDLLMILMRPPHYGAVGDNYRIPTRMIEY